MQKLTFCCYLVTKSTAGYFGVYAVPFVLLIHRWDGLSWLPSPCLMPSSSQSRWRQLISHWELVMSVMADGSKKYFLIHWQLLSHSYSRCCLELCWITQICALIKSSCCLVHKGPKSKLVFCWCFPLLCVHFINFIWSHKTPAIFFSSQVGLKVSRMFQQGQGESIGAQKLPSPTKHSCQNNIQQNLMHVCSWEQGGKSTHTLRCWKCQSGYSVSWLQGLWDSPDCWQSLHKLEELALG